MTQAWIISYKPKRKASYLLCSDEKWHQTLSFKVRGPRRLSTMPKPRSRLWAGTKAPMRNSSYLWRLNWYSAVVLFGWWIAPHHATVLLWLQEWKPAGLAFGVTLHVRSVNWMGGGVWAAGVCKPSECQFEPLYPNEGELYQSVKRSPGQHRTSDLMSLKFQTFTLH